GLYLVGSKLVVLMNDGHYFIDNSPYGPLTTMPRISFTSTQVGVFTFDISDPTNPVMSSKTDLSGALISSRLIGNQLYLVIRNNMTLPGPQLVAKEGSTNGASRYQTQDEYRQWLMDHEDALAPYFETVSGDGTVIASGSLVDDSISDLGASD